MSTEMKPDFFITWNERGVYFSSIHPIKKPVYKIHSSFMIFVIVVSLLSSYMNTNSSLIMNFLLMVQVDPFAMPV